MFECCRAFFIDSDIAIAIALRMCMSQCPLTIVAQICQRTSTEAFLDSVTESLHDMGKRGQAAAQESVKKKPASAEVSEKVDDERLGKPSRRRLASNTAEGCKTQADAQRLLDQTDDVAL